MGNNEWEHRTFKLMFIGKQRINTFVFSSQAVAKEDLYSVN